MAQIRFWLFRHGNAAPATNDADRELSDKGKAQVHARRTAMGSPSFDLVLSSTASRARDTAAGIAGISVDHVVLLPELYLPTDKADEDELNAWFERLKYASLQTYLDASETVKDMLSRFGENGEAAVWEQVDGSGASNVLVAGHAVLLPSVGLSIIGEDNADVLNVNLGEAHGICITLGDDDTTVKLIL